jgi:hypothetical protein
MLDMGLDYNGVERLIETLLGDRRFMVSVTLLDLNHNTLGSLTPYFYDGQVTINSTAEVTRSSSLTLFDPNRKLPLDGINPTEGALYYDKMVQISYFVWKPLTLDIFEIPVFTGPITEMERNGQFIDIVAMGKEQLALGAIWSGAWFNPGWKKYDIIRYLMRDLAGETKLDMTYRGDTIASPIGLGPEAKPWTEAQIVADSMGMQLFYDGRGYLRLRQRPTQPNFTFRDGNGGSIITKPKIKYDVGTLRNAVLVRGATPDGAASPITAQALAPAAHPFNHLKLGRIRADGVPVGRYLLEVIDDETIATQWQAQNLADVKRDEFLLQGVLISMDTACVPMLEEDDMAIAQVEGEYALPFRMREFTIPLTLGPNATVGTNVNVKIKRR